MPDVALEMEETGMDGVWRTEGQDVPAFVVVDDRSNDCVAPGASA